MEFTDHLTPDHIAMIERQSVFFVATAAAEGRINLSPKGYDAFRVLDGSLPSFRTGAKPACARAATANT